MKLTVHVILNSHLDPVWLWTLPQGIDEALATARAACDLLNRNPDIHITRGEAWFYDTVLRLDPRLFARMRGHVAGGRWHIVGGWWIQPDCNLPSAEGFLRQGEAGQGFFQQHFGRTALTGYNVDSFGHAATLPDFYAAAGISNYVMMRPQSHEMSLPSNLFAWEASSGARVITFRISQAYCTTGSLERVAQNMKKTIEEADRRVGHTMCFVGVGDHGGGPAQEEIAWIRAHADYAPDVELVFSHPDAFFDAVRESNVKLPVVRGELQHHAPGCYTVVHAIKRELRRAEELAAQAECVATAHVRSVTAGKRIADQIAAAWKRILFNQFHDILAGSSIRSAYAWAFDELGAARSVCREVIVDVTRKLMQQLKPCKQQQLLFVNASTADFDGYVEIEPWIGYIWNNPGDKVVVRLADENGVSIPAQRIKSEAAFHVLRLLARISLPARAWRVARIYLDREDDVSVGVSFHEGVISNNAGIVATPGTEGLSAVRFGDDVSLVADGGIRVVSFHDPSDTWGHGVASFRNEIAGVFSAIDEWRVHDEGPLSVSVKNKLRFNRSDMVWQVVLHKDETILRLRLRITWNDHAKAVKLIIPPPFRVTKRFDGCPGGMVERPCDGKEYPLFNYTSVMDGTRALAVVSRDIFGVDVTPDGSIGLTLLRSPFFAHHTPYSVTPEDCYPVTDHGVHDYEIALVSFDGRSFAAVESEVARQRQPVWMVETTKGMSLRKTPGGSAVFPGGNYV